MPAPALSVVVCTHNPRVNHLQRALAALQGQSLPAGGWELILVDNASREPVAPRFSTAWHPQARVVVEPNLGLTRARLAGIAAARAEVIVFVDDDNVLAPDYLAHALAIAREFPFLGAWGGQIFGEFETEPPAWCRAHLQMLALREFDADRWSNVPETSRWVPCGAGLCLRAAVARRYATVVTSDPLRLKLDRAGADLSSGGDMDLALTACDAGLGTGSFARLKLTHLIPRERLTLPYFERLVAGITCGHFLLLSLRGKVARPPARSRAERLFRAYRRWRLAPEQRALEDAYDRGEQQACALLGL